VARNVLIVPDKFKGTLSATLVAKAIARGWQSVCPPDRIRLLPMTDGGDGFGEVIGTLLGAKASTVRTVNAAHRPCSARWWWESKTRTAIIESAEAIGLSQLPPGKFHPFDLDTAGLAPLIQSAAARGAKRCLIGVGGSATNDGGFGMARALGWEFLDQAERSIERWIDLHRLARIRSPKFHRWFDELIVAVDVQNALLGPLGATRVYGPQKGLRPSDYLVAEKNLSRLARAVEALSMPNESRKGNDLKKCAGTGAAGGLSFGLLAFLNADLKPGFGVFAELANLNRHLRWANLVITGEGRIDRSSFMGKGVGEVVRRCHRLGIPVIALGGAISRAANIRGRFDRAHSLLERTTLRQAQARPALWLQRAAAHVAQVESRKT
jgi:glycerate 2-kinase